MKTKKLLAVIFALTVSTAMLTACGDSDSSDSSEAAATTTTTSAAAASSEAEEASSEEASSEEASSEEASSEEASSEEASSEEEKKEEIDRTGHNTFLMLADGQWLYSNMNDDDNDRPLPTGGKTAAVTEDGTYTVDVNLEDICDWMNSNPNKEGEIAVGDPAFGVTVLNIDIGGLAEQIGASTDSDEFSDYCDANGIKESKATAADKMAFARSTGFDVTELTIKADGEEVYTYKPEEIIFGDIESNGKIRIEIYNAYGESKDLAPQAIKDFAGEGEYETLEATFTVTGIKAAE